MAVKHIVTYTATFAAGALAFAAFGAAQGASSEAQTATSSPVSSEVETAAVPTEAQSAAGEQQVEPVSDDIAVSDTPEATAPPTKSPAEAQGAASNQTAVAAGSSAVTSIADLERNSRVVIEGVVIRASEEDEFIIEDQTGRVQVYTGTSFFVAEVGERVRVEGFVDESPLLEVYAQRVIDQDGRETVIRFD